MAASNNSLDASAADARASTDGLKSAASVWRRCSDQRHDKQGAHTKAARAGRRGRAPHPPCHCCPGGVRREVFGTVQRTQFVTKRARLGAICGSATQRHAVVKPTPSPPTSTDRNLGEQQSKTPARGQRRARRSTRRLSSQPECRARAKVRAVNGHSAPPSPLGPLHPQPHTQHACIGVPNNKRSDPATTAL